jgi:hypothetical protein
LNINHNGGPDISRSQSAGTAIRGNNRFIAIIISRILRQSLHLMIALKILGCGFLASMKNFESAAG